MADDAAVSIVAHPQALTPDSVARAEEVFTDILAMDLIHSSPQFLALIGRTLGETHPMQVVSLKHSVADTSLGETDIEVIVETRGERCAILIENKVRAPIMPRQFERYQLRGQAGVREGRWSRFFVLLMCPTNYFAELSGEHRQHIDSCLPYEDIVEFLAHRPDFGFKRHVFQNAVLDHRKGYAKTADAAMMAFYRRYWKIASAEFPQLNMTLPDVVGKDGSWIYFPSLYAGAKVRLLHKFKGIGCELAIVTYNGAALAEALTVYLEPDITPRVTKSMLFLNIKTPTIDYLHEFTRLEPIVRKSLRALERLRQLAMKPQVADLIIRHL